MTKEEILQEAQRRYPPGTKFKCANDGKKNGRIETRSDSQYDQKSFYWGYPTDGTSLLGMVSTSRGAWVYHDGKWAEIVNEELNKYQIY
jgi:hypothetical protein